MNTPVSAVALASVSDTTPTSPAMTATTTENRFGVLIRSETGRTPARYSFGVLPDHRMQAANSSVTAIARAKPNSSTTRPRTTACRSRRSSPSATAMIAAYSGPTTIAPTTRICELVKMPQAPIRPAKTSSVKKLGGYSASARIRASTSSHTGTRSPWNDRPRARLSRPGPSASAASTVSMITELRRSRPMSRSSRSTTLAEAVVRSNCTASPSGRRAAARAITRFSTPGSATSTPTRRSVSSAGLTTRTCSMPAEWAGRAAPAITHAG